MELKAVAKSNGVERSRPRLNIVSAGKDMYVQLCQWEAKAHTILTHSLVCLSTDG